MGIDTILNWAAGPVYFIHFFCWIEDRVRREWVPYFPIMKHIYDSLKHMYSTVCLALSNQLLSRAVFFGPELVFFHLVIVCYALWTMLFRHGSGILIFSRREAEASELLERMRGVHHRLPSDLRAEVTVDNTSELAMGHIASWARCFPTTKHSSRSFSATVAVVDEAVFIPGLKALLNAVKPTIIDGGQLILVSTANKENRASEYKRIWAGAVEGMNGYSHVFLPWDAHPGRNQAWYAEQHADYELDDKYQGYPATPEHALSPRRGISFPTDQ